MSRHPKSGQTLAEYILAAGLVAIVGIGALVLLSSAVSDTLPPLLDRIFGGDTPEAIPSGPLASGPASVGPGGFQEVQLTLDNGQTISLPAYFPGLSSAVESSGANGTTDMLADRLMALARELRESGQVDDRQAKSLMALANQGHRIAMIQRMIEDAAAADPNFDFNLHMFNFEGTELCPGDLSDRIGVTAPDGNMFGPNAQTGPEMARMLAEYQAAIDSGAMDDPSVHAAVTYLVQEIGDIAGNFTDVVGELHDGNMHLHGPLCSHVASQLTNQDSAAICVTGGDSDSGVRCTGG